MNNSCHLQELHTIWWYFKIYRYDDTLTLHADTSTIHADTLILLNYMLILQQYMLILQHYMLIPQHYLLTRKSVKLGHIKEYRTKVKLLDNANKLHLRLFPFIKMDTIWTLLVIIKIYIFQKLWLVPLRWNCAGFREKWEHGHLYYICWNLRRNIPVSNDSRFLWLLLILDLMPSNSMSF